MQTFLKRASAVNNASHDDEMISFWAADAVVEPGNSQPELVSPRNRFVRRMLSDAMKRSVWEGFLGRARSMNSAHVIDHFSAVTGHSIQDLAACMESDVPMGGLPGESTSDSMPQSQRSERCNLREERPPKHPKSVVSEEAKRSLGLARIAKQSSGSAMGIKQWGSVHRIGKRALVSTMGIYLMLVLVGSWEPALDIEAASNGLPEYSWLELGSHPRGRSIPPDMYVSLRYKAAVKKLQRASTSVFGYVPGMRQDLLNEGILELESAVEFQKKRGYIYPQALMLLADAYVRAGQPQKAVPLVNYIISRNGRKTAEATALRTTLAKRGVVD